jgi:hypothetical protein
LTQDPASPDSPADETLDANPFPGPKPYRLNQKELFFGRRNEVEELTSLVLSTSAVLIYAHSGSGKSSLLEAGLVPNLEENFDYRIFTVRFNELGQPEDGAGTPQANPFVDLVYDRVLSKDAPPPDARDIGQLAESLRDKYGETPTLLILDQLEGMFASQALWQERSAFLIQLRRALEDNYWLRAVLAIRSDYLANFLPHERELPAPTLIRYGLKSLRERAARRAIETAFKKTDTPLPPAEMDLVLERLLRLDVGVPGHPVKGQYANLIQLQILCRRLWDEKKEKIGSRSDAGVSDGSQVLQDSQVKLADYMQSFVNEEVARVARETQSDEGLVRHWLGELITPADRREFKLVDDEHDAGLPPEVLKELEEAGLIQIEQRNQLPYAELTHDSMVEAVKESNIEWFRIHQRGRFRRTAILAVVLAGLLALFPFLRTPTDQTLLTRTSGIVTALSVRIPIPLAPEGHVAVVHVSLSGQNGVGATVRVVADDQGKTQEKELARRAMASSNNGRVKGDVNFAIKTAPSASYAVIVRAPNLHYDVTVRSAPVIPDAQKAGASRTVSVNSPLFAVKLSPNQPLYLAFQFAYSQEVWAARALLGTGSGGPLIVESPRVQGYAVIWVHNLDNQMPVEVTEQSVSSGPGLYPGPQFHIRAANATISSIPVDQIKAPFAVETLCKKYEGASLDLIDSGGRSVGSTARSVPGGSVLVPAAHGSGYRLILLSTLSEGLDCRVSARSFAQQEITTTSSRTVKIGANQRFNAYPIRLASDAAIIVTNLNGASASLDCLAGKITESDSNRLLSFAPKDHDCVLSIARSSSKLGKSVTFPLLIVPTSGG